MQREGREAATGSKSSAISDTNSTFKLDYHFREEEENRGKGTYSVPDREDKN